jgi:hypothetical protein
MAEPEGKKHLRCGVCGKLSRPDNFVAGAQGAHDLDVAYQRSLSEPGRRGGFVWTVAIPSRGDLALQLRAARAVVERIERALGEGEAVDESALEDRALNRRQFAALASTYLHEAEDAVQAAQAELDLRRRQVEAELDRRGWR